MYEYKLKYATKEQALEDLLSKQVLTIEEGKYSLGQNINCVVELAGIEGVEGYHYDVLSAVEINFGDKEIFPNNPKHKFL
jgi:hypothetical protein